jgi:hypothetical protein
LVPVDCVALLEPLASRNCQLKRWADGGAIRIRCLVCGVRTEPLREAHATER